MTEKRPSLVDRYIVPPFSVLDCKQGYWQRRKKAWLDIGVDDLGSARAGMKVTGCISGSDPQFYELKNAAEKQLDRKLTTKEFREKYYQPHKSRLMRSDSGGIVSIFEPVLAELAYRWFCPVKGSVLDPFAGGAVRGVIASLLGRQYTGIDLSKDQLTTNRGVWRKLPAKVRNASPKPTWIHGDSQNLIQHVKGQFDFLFACPPYFDYEQYSDDPCDLSAMTDESFTNAYRQIIAASTAMLKQDRFAVFVVGDVRDKRGMFRRFVSLTIEAIHGVGLHLYNDAVLQTMIGSLPMRVGRQFDASRKLGKSHQNVLVFVKGDPVKAATAIGDIGLPPNPDEIIDQLKKTGLPNKYKAKGKSLPRRRIEIGGELICA